MKLSSKALNPFLQTNMGIPMETATSITEEIAKIMKHSGALVAKPPISQVMFMIL
jgi:hypothetical protein